MTIFEVTATVDGVVVADKVLIHAAPTISELLYADIFTPREFANIETAINACRNIAIKIRRPADGI